MEKQRKSRFTKAFIESSCHADFTTVRSIPAGHHSLERRATSYRYRFCRRSRQSTFLVTNYHVSAGRDPSTGQPLHSSGAVPDTLRVRYTVSVSSDELEWQDRDEPVLDVGNAQALWLEHPSLGRSVDVVAGSSRTLRARPSDGLSIVGFPFGVTAGRNLGVWTRGFIASEPDIDWNDRPCFLIDARTRQGQSGSPVLNHSPAGAINIPGGVMTISAKPVTNLLGIYSGRINDQSDLGIVWKVSALRDLLMGQKVGRAGL